MIHYVQSFCYLRQQTGNSCQLALSINIFHSCTGQMSSSRNYCLLKLELAQSIQKRPESRVRHFRKRWQCRHRSSSNKLYLDKKLVQRVHTVRDSRFANRLYVLKPACIITKHCQHTFLQESYPMQGHM